MNTYLTIMVTVLVATQIVRVVQNAVSLYRQEREVKRNIKWLKDNKVEEIDFLVQREVMYRLNEWLKEQKREDR